MRLERYFDPFLNGLSINPDKTALAGKQEGEWHEYSYKQVWKEANNLSAFLLKSGLEEGDKVLTISGNKPEIFFIDIGTTQLGGVHIPVFPNYNKDDFSFIIDQCLPKFVFVGGRLTEKIVQEILKEKDLNSTVIRIDKHDSDNNIHAMLSPASNDELERIEAKRDAVSAEDVYSIYYTSGTGGGPKGAVYKHSSIEMIDYIGEAIEAKNSDVSLSYLPISHAYEKPHILTIINQGGSVYFAESTATVVQNFSEVRPTFMTTVPILLEKLLDGIVAKSNELPAEVAEKYRNVVNKAMKTDVAEFYRGNREIANTPFAGKWRDLLGGNIRLIGSAGAALPDQVNQFFHAIGIPILECYGLTEVAMGTYNRLNEDGIKCGSVGRAARDVDVKLDPVDHEILIKSPYLTEEIYKIPELTNSMKNSEGYFRTGDIGKIDDDGFIYVVGRKKELFKLSNGRYFSPQGVENKLKESAFIENVIVYQDAKMIKAVISPERSLLTEDPEIALKKVRSEVDRIHNAGVLEIERITDIKLDTEPWSIENGKLTPTMKVKRFKILENA